MTIQPMVFRWDGDVMAPLDPRRADRQYVVGETYRLSPYEERSPQSHSHYYASLTAAYKNLPEDIGKNFATFDHFRKWCLIQTGFRDEFKAVAANRNEAIALATFIEKNDTYAVVSIYDCVVTVLTAKSQKRSAMDKKEFQRSKESVLDYAASLVGVTADELARNRDIAA